MSETPRKHPNVVHVEEVEPRTVAKGSRFGSRFRALKVGAMASKSITTTKPWVRNLVRADATLDYYEGEDVG